MSKNNGGKWEPKKVVWQRKKIHGVKVREADLSESFQLYRDTFDSPPPESKSTTPKKK